jgi:hypothetical protein
MKAQIKLFKIIAKARVLKNRKEFYAERYVDQGFRHDGGRVG